MKRKFFIGLLFFAVVYSVNTTVVAQQQNTATTAKYATSEDSAAMNALVLYPANIRTDIFEASEYPSAIVDIATLQKKTSNDFADLISGYSKEEQESLWNLSRYPALVTDLVKGGKKSEQEINAIASRYPAEIHDVAIKCGRNFYDILSRMEELHNQTNAQFLQITSDYPPVTQTALIELIQYPEIMNLLNEHLDMTVRVGAHYKRDPQEVIRKADERNREEVRQNAEDAEAWKQNMEQNPDEANDLKNAASDYATENGYTQEEINTAPNPQYVTNYTCDPYSYWFGYPTWYPYSYWYPYPFWFDCGFYYGPSGHMVFFGHPSYYFTNWYFYSPEHIHRYPHLGNTYINHYYGARRHIGGSDIIVRNWVRDNRNYLPKDFTGNKSNRVEAIRQVGQLNMDVRKEKGRSAISAGERDEYFQKNSDKYPTLNKNPEPVKENDRKNEVRQQIAPEPERQPPVRIPRPEQQQPTIIPQPEKREPRPADNNFNNINRAQEYHKNVWENTQPVSRPQEQQRPAPQPMQRAAPQPMQRPQPQTQPSRPQSMPSNASPGPRRR